MTAVIATRLVWGIAWGGIAIAAIIRYVRIEREQARERQTRLMERLSRWRDMPGWRANIIASEMGT